MHSRVEIRARRQSHLRDRHLHQINRRPALQEQLQDRRNHLVRPLVLLLNRQEMQHALQAVPQVVRQVSRLNHLQGHSLSRKLQRQSLKIDRGQTSALQTETRRGRRRADPHQAGHPAISRRWTVRQTTDLLQDILTDRSQALRSRISNQETTTGQYMYIIRNRIIRSRIRVTVNLHITASRLITGHQPHTTTAIG